MGCPACERVTGPNPLREQAGPVIHENVPVITQYASPGLIETIAYTGHDPGDDPAQTTTGAASRAEYAAWCRHLCGMACLQMVLTHRDAQAPALLELLRDQLLAGATMVEASVHKEIRRPRRRTAHPRVRDVLRRTRDHPRLDLTGPKENPDVIVLDDVLKAVPGALVTVTGDGVEKGFTRASTDTRDITGGELFFAISGASRDGHDFVRQAVQAGARGLVISRDVPPIDGPTVIRVPDTLAALQRSAAAVRRRSSAQVIAVTGSAGKTTAKTMIAQALGVSLKVLANRASYNNHLGVPLNLTGIDPHHTHVVAEIGTNHRGEIAHLTELAAPDLAVITNVGYAHLGNFTDRADLAREKTDLLRATRSGGTWVLNGDDQLLTTTAGQLPEAETARVIRVGFGPGNDVRAVDVTVDEHGTRGVIHLTGPHPRQIPFALAASGRHFAYAAMLAVAVADHYGIDPALAVQQLNATPPPPGRASLHRYGPHLLVIDDSYNASPDATLSALDLLGSLPAPIKIAALGEMRELGQHTTDLHQRVGAAAAAHATHLITVGEDAAPARTAAAAHGMPTDRIHAAASARDAHDLVRAITSSNDADDVVVLAKGARFRHLERVALGLAGRTITCDRQLCNLYINCAACPHLEAAE